MAGQMAPNGVLNGAFNGAPLGAPPTYEAPWQATPSTANEAGNGMANGAPHGSPWQPTVAGANGFAHGAAHGAASGATGHGPPGGADSGVANGAAWPAGPAGVTRPGSRGAAPALGPRRVPTGAALPGAGGGTREAHASLGGPSASLPGRRPSDAASSGFDASEERDGPQAQGTHGEQRAGYGPREGGHGADGSAGDAGMAGGGAGGPNATFGGGNSRSPPGSGHGRRGSGGMGHRAPGGAGSGGAAASGALGPEVAQLAEALQQEVEARQQLQRTVEELHAVLDARLSEANRATELRNGILDQVSKTMASNAAHLPRPGPSDHDNIAGIRHELANISRAPNAAQRKPRAKATLEGGDDDAGPATQHASAGGAMGSEGTGGAGGIPSGPGITHLGGGGSMGAVGGVSALGSSSEGNAGGGDAPAGVSMGAQALLARKAVGRGGGTSAGVGAAVGEARRGGQGLGSGRGAPEAVAGGAAHDRGGSGGAANDDGGTGAAAAMDSVGGLRARVDELEGWLRSVDASLSDLVRAQLAATLRQNAGTLQPGQLGFELGEVGARARSPGVPTPKSQRPYPGRVGSPPSASSTAAAAELAAEAAAASSEQQPAASPGSGRTGGETAAAEASARPAAWQAPGPAPGPAGRAGQIAGAALLGSQAWQGGAGHGGSGGGSSPAHSGWDEGQGAGAGLRAPEGAVGGPRAAAPGGQVTTTYVIHEAGAGDHFEEALHEVLGRLVALEERQRTEASAAGPRRGSRRSEAPPSMDLAHVQAELERLRKLFEFIEGVLPKEAAEAMRFFNSRAAAKAEGGDDAEGDWAGPLGAEVEFERRRTKLEEQVQKYKAELQHEFTNLTTVVKAVQRELGTSAGKVGDLGARVSRLEAQGPVALVAPGSDGVPGTGSSTPLQTRPPSGGDRPKGDLHHLVDPEGEPRTQLPFVSKKSLHEAVDGLREDVRNWLDALYQSMLSALQQKADTNDLNQIAHLTAAANMAGESLAMFAKRSLVGRCASCDTPFNVDINNVKRPPTVGGMQGLWPERSSPGAKVAIRPPEPLQGSTKLPKIQEPPRVSKDFPKGKVKPAAVSRNASQPDLRSHKEAQEV